MKPVLIKQPAGLGDIFFCQKIASLLQKQGHRVIWPVITKYAYVKNYLENAEYIDINSDFDFKEQYLNCNKGSIQEYNECIVISTDGCPESDDGGVMINKYKLVGLTYSDWKEFFNFKRDPFKEQQLFNLLNPCNEDFVFINRGTGGQGSEALWSFNVPRNKKIIELTEIPGYNIFDWCAILEKATEFHIMETCISYLIEKLSVSAKIYNLYHRSPSSSYNFKELLTIHKKPQKNIGKEDITLLHNS